MHLLERIQALAPHYRTRPSALGPLLRATGGALGALSVMLPRPYSEAIKGNHTLHYGRGIVIGRVVLSWTKSQVCHQSRPSSCVCWNRWGSGGACRAVY